MLAIETACLHEGMADVLRERRSAFLQDAGGPSQDIGVRWDAGQRDRKTDCGMMNVPTDTHSCVPLIGSRQYPVGHVLETCSPSGRKVQFFLISAVLLFVDDVQILCVTQ